MPHRPHTNQSLAPPHSQETHTATGWRLWAELMHRQGHSSPTVNSEGQKLFTWKQIIPPPPKVLHTTQISYNNFPSIRHLLRKYGNSEIYRTCEEEKPAPNTASWNFRTQRQSTKDKPSSVNQASERHWVFLGVQWLRIHLPMQGSGVQSLVQEDPTCRAPIAPRLQLLKPRPTACAPQEQPPRWGPQAPPWRAAPLAATRDARAHQPRPSTANKDTACS